MGFSVFCGKTKHGLKAIKLPSSEEKTWKEGNFGYPEREFEGKGVKVEEFKKKEETRIEWTEKTKKEKKGVFVLYYCFVLVAWKKRKRKLQWKIWEFWIFYSVFFLSQFLFPFLLLPWKFVAKCSIGFSNTRKVE